MGDHTVIEEEELRSRISSMMKCIELHSNRRRRIVLSSFSPDACIIVSAMNTIYPVMMLTDAGYYKYPDERRNSIRAAHQLAKNHDCLESSPTATCSLTRTSWTSRGTA